MSIFPATATRSFVGQAYQRVSFPTSGSQFFAVHPVILGGAETESGAGTYAVDATQTRYVYVIGKPSIGDYLVCHWASDRWVAERSVWLQAQTITIPDCPCTDMPGTLTMTVTQPPGANSGLFNSDTLSWQAVPPAYYGLALGSGGGDSGNCYIGAGTWTDTSTSDSFQYLFRCFSGFYVLTRVFAVSIFGSPYEDTIRYKWFCGFPGNTCGNEEVGPGTSGGPTGACGTQAGYSSFAMTNGTIYSGGDPSSVVAITG